MKWQWSPMDYYQKKKSNKIFVELRSSLLVRMHFFAVLARMGLLGRVVRNAKLGALCFTVVNHM
jgi:hypothetical protein